MEGSSQVVVAQASADWVGEAGGSDLSSWPAWSIKLASSRSVKAIQKSPVSKTWKKRREEGKEKTFKYPFLAFCLDFAAVILRQISHDPGRPQTQCSWRRRLWTSGSPVSHVLGSQVHTATSSLCRAGHETQVRQALCQLSYCHNSECYLTPNVKDTRPGDDETSV